MKPTKKDKSEIDQAPPEGFNPIPGLTDVALTPEDQVDIDKINEILQSNSIANGKIRLERKTPDDTNFQYIVSIPVNQFDIEWVKRVHGGGDYKAMVFRSNGQIYKNFEFSIDYRVKGTKDGEGPRQVSYQGDPMKQVKELADMVLRNSPKDESSGLLREIMAQSRQDSQMMMTTLITSMTKSAETQTAMMTGMFQAMSNQSQHKSPMESIMPALITAVAPVLIKLIDRPTPTQTNNLQETVELIRSIKDTFAGEDKEETVLGQFAKALAPAFSAMTGAHNQRNAPRPLPSPQPVESAPPNNANQTHQDNYTAMVKQYVGMLYSAAEMNADPAIYADMLFNHAPPEFLSRLITTLKQPDWTKALFADDPKVINNLPWFEELKTIIIETYEQPAGSDTHSDAGELGKSGIQDDSFTHVGTSGGANPGTTQGDGGNNQPVA